MTKKIIIALLCLTSVTVSKADTLLGVYINAQQWFYDYSGELNRSSLGDFDLEDDLNFGNQTASSISIAIEHPAPLIPNFKLRHNQFSHEARNTSLGLSTEINLNHTDLTLYYELLDNWVNLDLGISLMYFDGSSSLLTAIAASKISSSEILPALYAKAQFELPLTDLSASVSLNATNFSDKSVFDIEVSALYEIGFGFGIEAGYRRKALDFEDFNGLDVESNGSGVFAALQFHF